MAMVCRDWGRKFATTLAQSDTLDLPLRNLLTSKFQVLQLDPCVEATGALHTISQFFGVVALPWYFKFIVGVFSDSIPLLGTMRRHYVLLSATAAAALWFLAGQMQHSYLSLLAVITAMETMLVVCSTVMGALLVEVGQRLDAAGRLVAARIFVEGICAVIAGPLAGVLAGVPFGIAATVGAIVAFTVVPIAFIWLNEPATAKYQVSASRCEGRTAANHPVARAVACGRFIFVASMPQIFPTPLWNFQKCDMRLSDPTIGVDFSGRGRSRQHTCRDDLCPDLPVDLPEKFDCTGHCRGVHSAHFLMCSTIPCQPPL